MELCHAHSQQFLYPPHDQRTQLEAQDWHLSETQFDTLLTAGHLVEYDCSDLASYLMRLVGVWPTSRGPGYTGTWLDLGLPRYTDGKQALIAAPVIFGAYPGHHMGLVFKPDAVKGNPLIFEHGSPGIALTPLESVVARQTGEGHPGYTFLNVSRM
jgi:hypothetical protein